MTAKAKSRKKVQVPEPQDDNGRGMKKPDELTGGLEKLIERSMTKALGVKKRASKKCKQHGVYVSAMYEKDGKEKWSRCPDCLNAEKAEEVSREHLEEFQQARMRAGNKLISASGIPMRFAHATFDNYKTEDGERQEKALKVCRSYVENFRQCLAQGASMVMMGDVGTGKTHLACAIVKAISEKYWFSTTYITASRMYRALKATYDKNSKAKEQDVINEFIARDLLVIDELGISYNSQAEKIMLFDIINGRYEINRPTIIITNIMDKEKLQEWLTKPVYSRLTERGRAIVFDWESYRPRIY